MVDNYTISKNMKIEKLTKEKHGTIIDVRSHEEFMGGHVSNSINIPLDEILKRVEELRNLKAPLLLCCASGNRSGQAQLFLTEHGIECYNGGSWLDVNYIQSKTS